MELDREHFRAIIFYSFRRRLTQQQCINEPNSIFGLKLHQGPERKEIWPNYASGPKSATNSDSFWVHRLFNVCVRVFCAPHATILLVYIPA